MQNRVADSPLFNKQGCKPHGKLVSGVNLFIPPKDWQSPTNQMISTKLRFDKQGGRLAYHLEQGFKPGEVTPETAHQIGVELAKELFGDKYEVVVATHVDKEHIHNHILLNSVSFVDGRKFHQPNAMYYDRIRKASDRLCERYGLALRGFRFRALARNAL